MFRSFGLESVFTLNVDSNSEVSFQNLTISNLQTSGDIFTFITDSKHDVFVPVTFNAPIKFKNVHTIQNSQGCYAKHNYGETYDII